MDLHRVYQASFNFRPAQLHLVEHEFSADDVERFIDSWQTELDSKGSASRRDDQGRVYPLVSHHRFNKHSLFGATSRERIGARALGMLLAHDGLVCSDPVWEIVETRRLSGSEAASRAMGDLTARLADIEPLIANGAVRFQSVRPALADASRRAVLRPFGVDPDMRVFTNFAEAADTAAMVGGAAARSYIDQGSELLFNFGLLVPEMPDSLTLVERVEETRRRVEDLGRALLHLSWQLSVTSSDPAVDLALAGPIEILLFDYLLETTALVRPHQVDGATQSRHLIRAAAGAIPNVDRLDLTSEDALAMRRDDTFAGFRAELHSALDAFETDLVDSVDSVRAMDEFRERMNDASRRLEASVVRESFASRIKLGTVPVAIEAAVAVASTSPQDQFKAGVAAGIGAAATVIWAWLSARGTPQSAKIAIRYTSTLGAE